LPPVGSKPSQFTGTSRSLHNGKSNLAQRPLIAFLRTAITYNRAFTSLSSVHYSDYGRSIPAIRMLPSDPSGACYAITMRALLFFLAVVLIGCSSSKSTESGPGAGDPKAYLDKAAAQPGAIRTESGLVYRELRPGSGESPKPSDTVTVHYRGTLVDGTEFDSSYKRNEPAQFPLNQVIPCWTEGVQKMKVGGKSELVCPASIAYGDQGSPPTIPGGATLIFDIELLKIGG
jgi:FKBP-type peptidyl-prolyl cis-trans isomerase